MSAERHQTIQEAIAAYAEGYERLEKLQQAESKQSAADRLLPGKGDQKTGLIGEYWALHYARHICPSATITFAGHSQKYWDLRIAGPESPPLYVQVKTVSAFGQGKLSPIHRPEKSPSTKTVNTSDTWNELWILQLDRRLHPLALWRFHPAQVHFANAERITGTTIRQVGTTRGGSRCLDWDQSILVTDFAHLALTASPSE